MMGDVNVAVAEAIAVLAGDPAAIGATVPDIVGADDATGVPAHADANSDTDSAVIPTARRLAGLYTALSG